MKNIVKTILIILLMLAWYGPVYAQPIEVSNEAELNAVRDDLEADYIQTADITLIDTNWTPIAGGGTADIFRGSYDGQNYTISNLTIDRPATDNVGLFGHVGDGAKIKNVRLENVNVQGRRGVGSLIGRVSGNNQTVISRCYADGGTVVGFNGATGGLVGSHNSTRTTPGGEDNPVIFQCYANIDVSLNDPADPGDTRTREKFGGLAGCSQKGTIMDSYARGAVTVEDGSAERVGGLVGCVEFRGRVLRSYSTGLVTVDPGTERVGGLVGFIGGGGNEGVIEDSYWDTQTSGQATSAGGEGKSTDDMKDQTTFGGWDFDTIWRMDVGINDGYPYLLWADFVTPDNTQWTGNTDTDWETPGNWTEGVPGPLDNASIASTANDPVIGPEVIAETSDLAIEAGATLTIQSDGTNTGALIVNGEFSGPGEVIVERYLDNDRWYIIGPPVKGQDINAFLTEPANNIPESGDNYGVTQYNESGNKWGDYFTDATPGDFQSGTGYLIRRSTNGGSVNFTGTPETGGVDVPVTADGFRWNAVGNPYTAAIGVTGNATTPQNFLFNNFENLDPSYRALYIWDESVPADAGYYVIVNNAGFSNAFSEGQLTMDYVQLGQGFIVRATSAGEVSFTPQMRKGHPEIMLQSPLMAGQPASSTGKTTVRWPGVVVSATTSEGAIASAGITFHESMSLGLDTGYDAGVYKENNPRVAIYTRLASGDDGTDYGLQCLPPSAMDWISLPLGLETNKSGSVTLRFETSDLPHDTTVILEDTKKQAQKTITSADNTYTATVGVSDDPYGRFYLSFGESDGSDPPDNTPGDDDSQDDGDASSGSSGTCFINTASPF